MANEKKDKKAFEPKIISKGCGLIACHLTVEQAESMGFDKDKATGNEVREKVFKILRDKYPKMPESTHRVSGGSAKKANSALGLDENATRAELIKKILELSESGKIKK
jgi:hypothetical protein